MNRIIKKLLSNTTSLIGLLLLLFLVVIAIFAPYIAPPLFDDPYQICA